MSNRKTRVDLSNYTKSNNAVHDTNDDLIVKKEIIEKNKKVYTHPFFPEKEFRYPVRPIPIQDFFDTRTAVGEKLIQELYNSSEENEFIVILYAEVHDFDSVYNDTMRRRPMKRVIVSVIGSERISTN